VILLTWACLVGSKSSLRLRSTGRWCYGDVSSELVVSAWTTSLWNRCQTAAQVRIQLNRVLPSLLVTSVCVVKMRLSSVGARETKTKRKRNSFVFIFVLNVRACEVKLSQNYEWMHSCAQVVLFGWVFSCHVDLHKVPKKKVFIVGVVQDRIQICGWRGGPGQLSVGEVFYLQKIK